ncbi:MAG: DUF501 domain-containing protein [Thermoleophilia bacterium]|nr:DUF501 domain-containing protein [Thermoleophilia bacterium]
MAVLLGRPSFTDYRVAVRCPHGGPAVLENAPRDLRGRPFPTRYWLACRALHDAVSRLESTGAITELRDDPGMAPHIRDANERHAALHGGAHVSGVADPDRVKCLHAHAAFGLAAGGGPLMDWIAARADLAWPERCCLERFAAHGDGRGAG